MPDEVKDQAARLLQARPPAVAPLQPRAAKARLAVESPRAEEVEVDTARAEVLDRLMHAWQARLTYSISPAALMLAFMDWGMHLANAPGK